MLIRWFLIDSVQILHSWESQNSKLTLVLTLRYLGLSISDSILCPFLFVFLFLFLWVFFRLCLAACRVLVPWPGIKPVSLAVEVWSPNHWTTREFPVVLFFTKTKKKRCHRRMNNMFKPSISSPPGDILLGARLCSPWSVAKLSLPHLPFVHDYKNLLK